MYPILAKLRRFLLIPICALILWLAIANRHEVTIYLSPIETEIIPTLLTLPLYWPMFLLFVLGMMVGGGAVWRSATRRRHRDRAKWAQARREQDQQEEAWEEGWEDGREDESWSKEGRWKGARLDKAPLHRKILLRDE